MPIKNRILYSAIIILVLLLVAGGYYLVKSGRVQNTIQTETNPFSSANILLSATKGDGKFDVYQVMSDGSSKKLTSSDDANFQGGNNATFSPDGVKIAYVAITANNGSQIIEMNSDGSGKAQISKMLGFKFMPSWSKDGKSVLYVNQAVIDKPQIVQLGVATGAETVVVTGAADLSNPSWLPDGSGFTYLQSADGKVQHLMLHQNSKDTEIVVKNGDTVVNDFLTPAVSPDGKSLAFIRTSDNQAYTVDINGKNMMLHSAQSHSVFGCINWAADGSYLLVAEHDRTNSKDYVSKVSLSSRSVSRWVETGFTGINCPRVGRY